MCAILWRLSECNRNVANKFFLPTTVDSPAVPKVIRSNTILFAGVNLEARLKNNLLSNTSCNSLALVPFEVNFLLHYLHCCLWWGSHRTLAQRSNYILPQHVRRGIIYCGKIFWQRLADTKVDIRSRMKRLTIRANWSCSHAHFPKYRA